jgi:CheY-like chemotaxis protein
MEESCLVPSEKSREDIAVAIVDDNMDVCKLVTELMTRLGFKKPATVVHDGMEIVNAVTKGGLSPDVIIMDYRLPSLNGIEASKIISKNCPGTRIILATADESVKPAALSLGLKFLQKPFSIRDLLCAISI